MEIVITIKIEGNEPVKVDVKQTDRKTVQECSEYARFFDDTNPAWCKDSELNLMYLKSQETYANDRLKARGYLFLNEVYDMLGIPRSKAGQVVGWFYDTTNPTDARIVDFGLTDERNADFVNGYKRDALLDFNVEDNILDKMD